MSFDITESLNTHRLQDYQALVGQGEIYDRTSEKLASSDGNISILRKIVKEAIEDVQRGVDPKGVWRGPQMDKVVDLSSIVIDGIMTDTAA